MTPYSQGFADYKTNQDLNPYELNTENAVQWYNGWLDSLVKDVRSELQLDKRSCIISYHEM